MIGEPAEKPSQVKGFEVLKWDDGSKRINSLFHSNNSEILGAGYVSEFRNFGIKKDDLVHL